MAEEREEAPAEDDAATKPPADEPPKRESEPDESGGPYGNPEVDEEALRKKQENTERDAGGR